MKPRQAKVLILHEGCAADGVVVLFRMGTDPGPVRMRKLIDAIEVLFHSLEGREKIDREVAAALFALGTEVPVQIDSWTRNGGTWREELVHRELVLLLLAIESLFVGQWLGEESAESPPKSMSAMQSGDLRSKRLRQVAPARGAEIAAITVENRRKNLTVLKRTTRGALILDLTSKGDEPWVRFSPFYPHGGIPVPNAPDIFAQSVEGLWQGLKVFEREDIDPSRWQILDMQGIKRGGTKRGKVLGHRFGPDSAVLLGYRSARYKIYLPAYRWVLENRLLAEIAHLRSELANRPLVLLDYETNSDVDDLSRPLSHAALVKAHLENDWPSVPAGIKGGNAKTPRV